MHDVDVARLDRFEEYPGGVVEGWTTLTATWHHGELHVQAQEPTPPPEAEAARWTSPPCRPPGGGWPVVPLAGSLTAANLPAPPPRREAWAELTITQITQVHPQPAQPVLVVAAEDPERAEHALRPTFGAALCVVGSRYRQRDIDAAQDRLRQELSARRWRLTSTGRSADDDGQPTVTARFAWIESEVAPWATTVPDGLLDADVWLTPIARRPSWFPGKAFRRSRSHPTRAARYHDYGPADVLVAEDVPEPHAGPGEIRIRVTAASVNPVDWKLRSGATRAVLPVGFPAIPGRDAAGVVDEVGEDVTGVTVGDRVFGLGGLFGASAEYATLTAWAPVPDQWSLEQAAGAGLAVATAGRGSTRSATCPAAPC